MSDATASDTGQVLAADGTPLKKRLAQALFVSRLRAFGLVSPLLAFIVAFFFIPVFVLLYQGIHNGTFASVMVRTTPLLEDWDAKSEPGEEFYAALVGDLVQGAATDRPRPTQVAARVNREQPGTTSMFKKLLRSIAKLKVEYEGKEENLSTLFRALAKDEIPMKERTAPAAALGDLVAATHAPFKEMVLKADKKWGDVKYWRAMKVSSKSFTPSFVASALDMVYTADGEFVRKNEKQRIHLKLFVRTMKISLMVTVFCLILGYPVAFLLSTLPLRTSNLLLILVLLPFWTSILVRTTAWIAILQSQGALNDIFVFLGIAADDARFSMIYNQLGTLIAMTHILLPFMILPLYSVMKTIPPSYVRAAKSLGATNWTAFWRVYAPQTVPGIGAGAILVFIIAIGYYITPALVGGQDGVMISNLIDEHMRKSLNYSLAAALGLTLLVVVLFLFWLYDRFVGIDNMKLG